MTRTAATVAAWLHWESSDRQTAWAGLQDIADGVARGVGSRFHLQRADQEDLAADVFFLAVENGCARLRALDEEVSLAAWLWGAARNLTLTRCRLRATTPLACSDLNEFGDDAGDEGATDARRSEPSTIVADVARLLGVLTPAQREVEVALLEGLSERAIARMLKISRNAVRERLSRGRRRIRRRVAETGAAEGPGARADARGQRPAPDPEPDSGRGAPDVDGRP